MDLEHYSENLEHDDRITWMLYDKYMKISYLYSMSMRFDELKKMVFWESLKKNDVINVVKNGKNIFFKLRSHDGSLKGTALKIRIYRTFLLIQKMKSSAVSSSPFLQSVIAESIKSLINAFKLSLKLS